MIKYFIEHKETRLWWYMEDDLTRPCFITSFNGSTIRMPGYEHKDMWTNDPFKAFPFNTQADAQKAIDRYTCRSPEGSVEVTEHVFVSK